MLQRAFCEGRLGLPHAGHSGSSQLLTALTYGMACPRRWRKMYLRKGRKHYTDKSEEQQKMSKKQSEHQGQKVKEVIHGTGVDDLLQPHAKVELYF